MDIRIHFNYSNLSSLNTMKGRSRGRSNGDLSGVVVKHVSLMYANQIFMLNHTFDHFIILSRSSIFSIDIGYIYTIIGLRSD